MNVTQCYQPLLLVIDDETAILKTVKEALEDEGFRVHTLNETKNAIDLIGQLVPDLILLDIFMPNNNGIEFLEKIKKEYPNQDVIIISGFGNIQIALDAVKKGARDFIEKPLNLDEILAKIEYLKNQNSTDDNQTQTEDSRELVGIIGESYLFKELMHQVNQLTKLPFPILIYGQYGVGKSLIARYIHHKKYKTDDSFFEFNGASQPQINLLKTFFTTTPQGTLYIKNIDALSLTFQKKLLHYLELPSNNNLTIIASSTIPLFKLVQENKFDGLLFYKLNITPLEIPPLTKRRYDIPLLINYYLEQANKQHAKSLIFSTASIRFLRNHQWHGNVLELRTFIEKIVALTPDNQQIITPPDIQNHLPEKDHQFLEEQTYTHYTSLQEATSAFEKNFLLYLLKKNHYDLEQLSDRLNLNIPKLRAKILELSINLK